MSGGGRRHIVEMPLATVGTSNYCRREHHMARAKRVKGERLDTALLLRALLPRIDPSEVESVHLVRVSPRLADNDGAIHALKAVRDEVAKHLGIDDGPGGVTWTYDQRKGAPGVHIEIAVKGDGK